MRDRSLRIPARPLAFALMTALVLGGTAAAQPSKRVFPDRIEIEKTTLRFNGVGLCEWGIFGIDLYWGALYLEKPTRFAYDVISSKQAKRIHLHFVRTLTRDQLRQAFTAAVEYNAKENIGRYRAALGQLCNMMTEIKKGQCIVFDYVPKKGLQVTVNKKNKGWIADEAFSTLFFRLYFGKYPPDKNLKKGMLENRKR